MSLNSAISNAERDLKDMHRLKSEIENSLRSNRSLLSKLDLIFSQLKPLLTSLLVLSDSFYFSKILMRSIEMEEFSLKSTYLVYFLWTQASVFHEQISEKFSEMFSFKNKNVSNFSYCELFDKKNLLSKMLEKNKPITAQLTNKYCLMEKVIDVGTFFSVYDPTLNFMEYLLEEEEYIIFEDRNLNENIENMKIYLEKGQKLILHEPSPSLLRFFEPLLEEYETGKWNEKDYIMFKNVKIKNNPKFKIIIILTEKQSMENLHFIKNPLIIYNDINEKKLWNNFFGAIFCNKTTIEEKGNGLFAHNSFAEGFWEENEELFLALLNEIKKVSSNDEDCKEIIALYGEIRLKVAEACKEDEQNVDLFHVFFKKIRKAKSPDSENKSHSLSIIQNQFVLLY